MADVVRVRVLKTFGGAGNRHYPAKLNPGERVAFPPEQAADLFRAGLVEPDEDVKGDGNENATESTR